MCCCIDNDVVSSERCWTSCFNWFWQTEKLDATKEYKRLLQHPDIPKTKDDWNPIWLATWNHHDYDSSNSQKLNANNLDKLVNKQAFIQFYRELNKKQSWIES